ncbi:alpha/beta fold hydrolase, partial [Bacteroidota bacterium]
LHGGAGFSNYSFLKDILDDLVGNGTISPVILVAPEGTGGPFILSCYTNSELNGNYEDFGVYDLVEFIDSEYRTIPTPEKRAIMGHSWGGYSCMMLALKHSDVFGAVASHSGTLDLTTTVSVRSPLVLAENGGTPPYNFDPDAGPFTFGMFAWSAAFSPNLNNPPYLVDFPISRIGNIIDSVMVRWKQHDPSELAELISSNSGLEIYFDCGMSDELGNYEMNLAFADSLDLLGIPYEFHSYAGGHSDQLQNRFPVSLDFLNSAMVTSTEESLLFDGTPDDYILAQNFPNPFNPSTRITYSIPHRSFVSLKVYDVLGNEVAELVSEENLAGNHEIRFNAGNLSSGLYFYKLIAGDYVSTKKMILLK